jgi:plastocyanin
LTRGLKYSLLKLMNDQKLKYLLGAAGIIGFIAIVLLVIYQQQKKSLSPSLKETSQPLQQQTAPPTLSPEQIEIISKIETHTVEIANGQFNPPTLTIKAHDQVMWQNKDGKTHKITGENWGNVPIANGESFTQAFDTPGTYSYSCALYPEMKGTIIVK